MHLCQDHSSRSTNPSFPANGVFRCDPGIVAICARLFDDLYIARLKLGNPGAIFVYGKANAAYIAALRTSQHVETTAFCQVVCPMTGSVWPQAFNMAFVRLADKSVFGSALLYEVPHLAAAGKEGTAVERTRSLALAQD